MRAARLTPRPYPERVADSRRTAQDAVSGLSQDALSVLRLIGLAMSDAEISTAMHASRQRVGRLRRELVVTLRLVGTSPSAQRVELARLAIRSGLTSAWSPVE